MAIPPAPILSGTFTKFASSLPISELLTAVKCPGHANQDKFFAINYLKIVDLAYLAIISLQF